MCTRLCTAVKGYTGESAKNYSSPNTIKKNYHPTDKESTGYNKTRCIVLRLYTRKTDHGWKKNAIQMIIDDRRRTLNSPKCYSWNWSSCLRVSLKIQIHVSKQKSNLVHFETFIRRTRIHLKITVTEYNV